MTEHAPHAGRARSYQNGALTVIALCLGVMVLQNQAGTSAPIGPAAASAAPADEPDGGGRVNAADQRKQIIAELSRLSQAVSRLDAKLGGTLNVKVTEMPEVRIAGGGAPAQDGAGKP